MTGHSFKITYPGLRLVPCRRVADLKAGSSANYVTKQFFIMNQMAVHGNRIHRLAWRLHALTSPA
jgi:hypothetical protein